MNVFQRLIRKLAPPPDCGHGAELSKLRSKLIPSQDCGHEPELQRLRELVERGEEHVRRLLAANLLISSESAHLETTHDELLHEHVRLVLAITDTDAHATADPNTPPWQLLEKERQQHKLTLGDLAGRIEEGNSRVADLEQRLRARGIPVRDDEQLDLGALANAEPGGEAPIAEDEAIMDKIYELAYRLVGIWFEGKNHWVLARGDERIKAPIHDREFLELMRRGEVGFLAGDTLLADFRVITYREAASGDIYAIHSVEKVKRVIHPDEQLELPGGEVAHV